MKIHEQMRFISQIALLKQASKELHKAIDDIIVELHTREKVEMAMYDEIKHILHDKSES